MTDQWHAHVARWGDCRRCPLSGQRDRICLARGTVPCDVVFIGEAPGSVEDALGEPFRGPAGNLLQQIIDSALVPWQPPGTSGPDYNAVQYALTNLVACYPAEAKAAGTNEPHMQEINACRPRLIEFINLCRPRLLVCVGTLASDNVDHGDHVPCLDILHPAFILARLPLVQKRFAVQKCVVQVRTAVDKMMRSESKPFTEWGTRYARPTKVGTRKLARPTDEDDIPF